jgi:hypothetical protein
MKLQSIAFAAVALAGCARPSAAPEPSLAPRAAEAIDPRAPIPETVPSGPVDPALAARIEALLGEARAGIARFEKKEAEASSLAARAGPISSESWVVAQQALSQLVERYGVATRVAADIDALASSRLKANRWIRPADREAIAAAQSQMATISEPQAAAVARIRDQLAR